MSNFSKYTFNIIVGLIMIVIITTVCFNLDNILNTNKVTDQIYKPKTIEISINEDTNETLFVTTRNNVIKILSCGQVLRQEWKELNPNEDGLSIPINTDIVLDKLTLTSDDVGSSTTIDIDGFVTSDHYPVLNGATTEEEITFDNGTATYVIER